jgi:hypothetical protein
MSPAKPKKGKTTLRIDVQLWRRIRAEALRQRKPAGDLVGEALSDYLSKVKASRRAARQQSQSTSVSLPSTDGRLT